MTKKAIFKNKMVKLELILKEQNKRFRSRIMSHKSKCILGSNFM